MGVKTIELSQGKQARVDDDDHEWLMNDGNWSAAKRRGRYYAVRNSPDNPRLQQYMHCVIMDQHAEHGIAPGLEVDHADNDGLNNQKENLELVSGSENTRRFHRSRKIQM